MAERVGSPVRAYDGSVPVGGERQLGRASNKGNMEKRVRSQRVKCLSCIVHGKQLVDVQTYCLRRAIDSKPSTFEIVHVHALRLFFNFKFQSFHCLSERHLSLTKPCYFAVGLARAALSPVGLGPLHKVTILWTVVSGHGRHI